MDERPRGRGRFRWRIAGLLGLVAVAAILFRGLVYRSSDWTIRVVNEASAPLEGVCLVQDGAELPLGDVPVGRSVDAKIRDPKPAPAQLRYRLGGRAKTLPVIFQGLGPPFGSQRVLHVLRVGDAGLRSAHWSMSHGLFFW